MEKIRIEINFEDYKKIDVPHIVLKSYDPDFNFSDCEEWSEINSQIRKLSKKKTEIEYNIRNYGTPRTK